jgi:hypothetical protein
VKRLSLRPYHGEVWLCGSLDELRKTYKRLFKAEYPYTDDPGGGRYIHAALDTLQSTKWLVFAATPEALAHEMAHVLLHTFRVIEHDPRQGDGEPFCHMLSQLILEAEE